MRHLATILLLGLRHPIPLQPASHTSFFASFSPPKTQTTSSAAPPLPQLPHLNQLDIPPVRLPTATPRPPHGHPTATPRPPHGHPTPAPRRRSATSPPPPRRLARLRRASAIVRWRALARPQPTPDRSLRPVRLDGAARVRGPILPPDSVVARRPSPVSPPAGSGACHRPAIAPVLAAADHPVLLCVTIPATFVNCRASSLHPGGALVRSIVLRWWARFRRVRFDEPPAEGTAAWRRIDSPSELALTATPAVPATAPVLAAADHPVLLVVTIPSSCRAASPHAEGRWRGRCSEGIAARVGAHSVAFSTIRSEDGYVRRITSVSARARRRAHRPAHTPYASAGTRTPAAAVHAVIPGTTAALPPR
ncbi:hypothetical protein EDC01DRAFT_781350 [Geopyxis carbonaria]|nr:hypothetical protein EDC01DRAFT_781350 [Geopyxis carbonaria]